MRRTTSIPVAIAAAALLATAFPSAAQAAEPEVVVDGLISPLSVAVAADGTVYASQNFAGMITKVGQAEPVYADEGGREIGGLSVTGDVITFTATQNEGQPRNAHVYTLTPAEGGGLDQNDIADTWTFEKTENPDAGTTYGIGGLSKSCKKSMPKAVRPVALPHPGGKNSHPYATAVAGGVTYVADAGANAILKVEGDDVTSLAVLPPAKAKITNKLRKGFGLPKCTLGKTLKGEAVPTDVEIGPDGNLYVTTLGGAIGEQMPAGALYQVTPAGAVKQMAPGLMSPTGLAISPTGTAYISLLFPGVVLEVPFGQAPSEFAKVKYAGDVEVQGGSVYVTRAGLEDPPTGPFTGAVLKYPAN